MTKSVSHPSEPRIRVLLCSSAAVLLAACGGGTNAAASREPGQAPQTAAYAANFPAVPAASGDTPETASTLASAGAGDEAADPTPATFDLVGYESDPFAHEAETDATAETAPAPGQSSAPDRAWGARLPVPGEGDDAKISTARNLYVATNGADSNPGTKAMPYRTIVRASQNVVPNTNIFVAPGTYPGGFTTTASGSPKGRVYYVSTEKWGARIVPPAKSTNNSAWDNRGNYVQIIGFDIDGTSSQGGTDWLHGIYTGGSYGAIKENHVHHLAKSVSCNGAGGSAIGVDSYYHGVKTDVIGNHVHDIGPAGCKYVQGIYMSTSGSVKNNVVYRVSEAAIHLWHDATNVVITNNTVAASGTGIIVGGGDFYFTSAGADNSPVYNNIVYDNKYGISEQGKTGKRNTYRNNLVYGNTYNWTLKNGLSHTGTVSSEPLFVGYSKTSGRPNFRLDGGSPAVGRGTETNAYPTDIDGKPRNHATGFDIGAYQH